MDASLDSAVTVTTSNSINKITINCMDYTLNSHAIITIECYNNDQFIQVKTYRLPDDVFNAWGTDDNVILTHVTTNLSTILN